MSSVHRRAVGVGVTLAIIGCAKSAGDDLLSRPVLKISESGEIDLGVVPVGGAARHDFEIRNVSPSPQRLVVAEVSCGCTDAKLGDEVLQAGEAVTLTVVMRNDEPGGKGAKAVVAINSEDEPVSVQALVKATFAGLAVNQKVIRLALSDRVASGQEETLTARGTLTAYDTQAVEVERLVFAEQGTDTRPALECEFGEAKTRKLGRGVATDVPFQLRLQAVADITGQGNYRTCSFSLQGREEAFTAEVPVFVEWPENYVLQPPALVLRVRESEDSAVGEASFKLVARRGVSSLDDLTIETALDDLNTRRQGTVVSVNYRGQPLLKPTNTELVLRSESFRTGEMAVPVLLMPQ